VRDLLLLVVGFGFAFGFRFPAFNLAQACPEERRIGICSSGLPRFLRPEFLSGRPEAIDVFFRFFVGSFGIRYPVSSLGIHPGRSRRESREFA
jgi:hypothetical protein